MATYYYNLRVVSCRNNGGKTATGSLTNQVRGRQPWVFVFESTESKAADAKAAFIEAAKTAHANAPGQVRNIGPNTGLWEALSESATLTNDGLPEVGKWSQRVGKDVLRYEIGVSKVSAEEAVENRTAHELL